MTLRYLRRLDGELELQYGDEVKGFVAVPIVREQDAETQRVLEEVAIVTHLTPAKITEVVSALEKHGLLEDLQALIQA